MENKLNSLKCLFGWILDKGVKNLNVSSKELNGDEFLSLQIGRSSVSLRNDAKYNWGDSRTNELTLHYSLMLACGYLIKEESVGWICFKLGDGNPENIRKYDLPSTEQCSCLRTAYNQGDCKHIKMVKAHLLIQERVKNEYKEMYHSNIVS